MTGASTPCPGSTAFATPAAPPPTRLAVTQRMRNTGQPRTLHPRPHLLVHLARRPDDLWRDPRQSAPQAAHAGDIGRGLALGQAKVRHLAVEGDCGGCGGLLYGWVVALRRGCRAGNKPALGHAEAQVREHLFPTANWYARPMRRGANPGLHGAQARGGAGAAECAGLAPCSRATAP